MDFNGLKLQPQIRPRGAGWLLLIRTNESGAPSGNALDFKSSRHETRRVSPKEAEAPVMSSGRISEPSNELWAVNITKGEKVLARRIEWAGTSARRRRGLLGRSKLDPDEGIYLAPCKWIHMFGMEFPIDVAFLSSEGRVVSIHHSLKPNRLSRPAIRAEGALELAAGRLSETGTEIGDVIEFREPPV